MKKLSNRSAHSLEDNESSISITNPARNVPPSNNSTLSSGLVLDQDETIVEEYIAGCCRYSSDKCSHYNDMKLNRKEINVTSTSTSDIAKPRIMPTDAITKNKIMDIEKAVEYKAQAQNTKSICSSLQDSDLHTDVSTSNLNREACENAISLYYCDQMTTNYKKEESVLKPIICRNVSTLQNSKLKLHIYYHNRSLQQLFIQKKPALEDIFNEVYQYSCNEESCNNSNTYIGYTSTLLKFRLSSHSSIS